MSKDHWDPGLRTLQELMYWLRDDLYSQTRSELDRSQGETYAMVNPPRTMRVDFQVRDPERCYARATVNGVVHETDDATEAWLDEVLP